MQMRVNADFVSRVKFGIEIGQTAPLSVKPRISLTGTTSDMNLSHFVAKSGFSKEWNFSKHTDKNWFLLCKYSWDSK